MPIATWVTSSTLVREIRSASTPAGNANTRRGRLREAAIHPTHTGEAVICHISQEPAVIWKKVPKFEASDAAQIDLNSLTRNGAKAVMVSETDPEEGGAFKTWSPGV
jgi:hypothetical protein